MFPTRLKELRKSNKLTQTELAAKLGVTQTAVWKWEKGLGEPSIDTLVRLSEMLGCTVDDLVRGEKE